VRKEVKEAQDVKEITDQKLEEREENDG